MRNATHVVVVVCALAQVSARAADVQQWDAFETSYDSKKTYSNPLIDVEVNVVFCSGGKQWVAPAFWAGGGKWTVRFAPPVQGEYTFHVESSDPANADLNGHEQALRVTAYTGHNPLFKYGFLRVSANKRHFEYADRRIKHLVDAGIVPVIVGGWGRPQHGGKSTIAQVGLDGYKRHWRYLVARYGAHPVVWIVGGEARDSQGPWAQVAKYLKATDRYRHLLVYHAPGHPRQVIKDNAVFDFDMVAIGHRGYETAAASLELMKSCLSQKPAKPVLCGEACYEGHMQTNFQNVQRHLFWSFMLSGAAGHTHGAAGIWHASVEGDTGIDPVYDWTTWKEGMNYPGSTQFGLGKKLLERYLWWHFETHPEWTEKECFAAGIPGEVRIIYLPRNNIYDWSGPAVKNLDPSVDWRVYHFDPATGRTFEQGTIKASAKAGDKTAAPLISKRTFLPRRIGSWSSSG